jgi:cation diffusion facilitator CzcD-associated flavoprotein CzcO
MASVIIIGSGISGINMAIQLIKHGIIDFHIYSQDKEPGGTWFVNSYPGAACDIPAILYSLSHEETEWSRLWPGRNELLRYMQQIFHKYQLNLKTTFATKLLSAHWINQKWRIELLDVDTGRIIKKECKVLVTAVGILSIPKECPIVGQARFRGTVFHSQKWDHSVDLYEKNVVVIGNGM